MFLRAAVLCLIAVGLPAILNHAAVMQEETHVLTHHPHALHSARSSSGPLHYVCLGVGPPSLVIEAPAGTGGASALSSAALTAIAQELRDAMREKVEKEGREEEASDDEDEEDEDLLILPRVCVYDRAGLALSGMRARASQHPTQTPQAQTLAQAQTQTQTQTQTHTMPSERQAHSSKAERTPEPSDGSEAAQQRENEADGEARLYDDGLHGSKLPYGETSGRSGTAETASEHLHDVLKRMAVQRPLVLLGVGYGALVSRFYAQLYEGQVDALVLLDPLSEDLLQAGEPFAERW
jgi:hypothetical protein